MDDADKFHEKVVGSIVRIRIPNSDKKQETYRLVLVAGADLCYTDPSYILHAQSKTSLKIVKLLLILHIGTSKVAKPYKLGERNTDVMLEILNLDKKEVISIDGISNQNFCEVIKHTAFYPIFLS